MKKDKSEEDIKSDILEKHKELSKEQLDYLLTLEKKKKKSNVSFHI